MKSASKIQEEIDRLNAKVKRQIKESKFNYYCDNWDKARILDMDNERNHKYIQALQWAKGTDFYPKSKNQIQEEIDRLNTRFERQTKESDDLLDSDNYDKSEILHNDNVRIVQTIKTLKWTLGPNI